VIQNDVISCLQYVGMKYVQMMMSKFRGPIQKRSRLVH